MSMLGSCCRVAGRLTPIYVSRSLLPRSLRLPSISALAFDKVGRNPLKPPAFISACRSYSDMPEFEADVRELIREDASLTHVPKRIVICCDGTWQSSVTTKSNIPSNVTRIARYIANAGRDAQQKEWQQLVYYDPGIGTGVSDFEAKLEGGSGSGFVGNVIEAYNFIVMNYNLGDQIFCVGFSRGAYTARAVAGLVTDIGIVRPRDMQEFPELYRLYQDHKDSHAFRKSVAWREWVEGKRLFDPTLKNVPDQWKRLGWEKRPHGSAPESTRWVEAVGVFDTVGSLGIPNIEGAGLIDMVVNWATKRIPVEKFGFHNVELSPYIKHAYHAMALDEHRKPFGTTMWHYPVEGEAALRIKPRLPTDKLRENFYNLRDSDSATEKEIHEAWGELVDADMYHELGESQSQLIQVWFPGVHINVGGGSSDLLEKREGDFEQIAMITLCWMTEQLKRHIAFELDFTKIVSEDRFHLIKPVVDKFIADKETDNWLMKKIADIIAKDPKNDKFHDHNQTRTLLLAADALKGWATGPIIDSYSGAVKKAGSEYRTPGGYTHSPDGTKTLGATHEYIHPTVNYRSTWPELAYKPVALTGFKRNQVKKDGKVAYEWVKGNIRIPEWKVTSGETGSYERSCMVSDTTKAYVASLDKEYGYPSE